MTRRTSLADVNDALDAAYARVKRAVGGVPVIAVPYPVPVTAPGRCSGVLLDATERQFVAGFVRELNAVIRDAAARNGVLWGHQVAPIDALLQGAAVPQCTRQRGGYARWTEASGSASSWTR